MIPSANSARHGNPQVQARPRPAAPRPRRRRRCGRGRSAAADPSGEPGRRPGSRRPEPTIAAATTAISQVAAQGASQASSAGSKNARSCTSTAAKVTTDRPPSTVAARRPAAIQSLSFGRIHPSPRPPASRTRTAAAIRITLQCSQGASPVGVPAARSSRAQPSEPSSSTAAANVAYCHSARQEAGPVLHFPRPL